MRRLFYQENFCNLPKPIEKKHYNSQKKRAFGTDITSQNVIVSKVDENDIKDPKLLGEYAGEIYKILHHTEGNFMPNSSYMTFQSSINESMRATLIDWLFDVHFVLNLLEETLFLTINILDRYLEKNIIDRNLLQLIGVTCMFIACKFQETFYPEINDFVYITDNAYTKKDIISTEKLILKSLDYQINVPSSLQFLERYSKVCKFDLKTYYIGLFLIELALIDYKFIEYKPSTISAAAIYLSKKILKNALNEAKKETHHEENIEKCVLDFIELFDHLNDPQFQAIKKKFLSEVYLQTTNLFD